MANYATNDKIIEYEKYLNKTFFKLNKNAKADINLVSIVYINFNDDPDTIYTHSPQQYPIEFICFVGGIASLWAGFSVASMYAYGKHVFNRKQNKIEAIKVNVSAINNKKIASTNKNDKTSSVKNVMKAMKILKKKNQVAKSIFNNNV